MTGYFSGAVVLDPGIGEDWHISNGGIARRERRTGVLLIKI